MDLTDEIVMRKPKGTKKKDDRAQDSPGCWINLSFIKRWISSNKSKLDDSETNKPTKNSKSKSTTSTTAASASTSTSTLSINDEEIRISSNLQRFSFEELKYVTKNFRSESVIGQGGFGCVYKGWINNSIDGTSRPKIPVAVKKLKHGGLQGHREWLAEVNYLGELLHPNLVKLIGYCIENDHRLLVYDFIPRGSLENHLFRRSLPLPWSIRLKIVLGAAKGLAFLHEEAERPVIFRDFKTSNILLDAEYNPKLSDFGLAKDGPVGDCTHVSTRVMGTYGYAAPEYVMTGHLTTKSDVYSFGVVLLEMLTGKKAIDKTRRSYGDHNLVEWARPIFEDRYKFYKLMDPRFQGHFSVRAAHKAIRLAARCLSRDPKLRPRMTEVVDELKPLLDLNDTTISSPSFHVMQSSKHNAHANANVASSSRSVPNSPFCPNQQPSPSPINPKGRPRH